MISDPLKPGDIPQHNRKLEEIMRNLRKLSDEEFNMFARMIKALVRSGGRGSA